MPLLAHLNFSKTSNILSTSYIYTNNSNIHNLPYTYNAHNILSNYIIHSILSILSNTLSMYSKANSRHQVRPEFPLGNLKRCFRG